jgi:MFS family permease
MRLFIEYLQRFGRFQRNAQLYLLTNALTGVSGGIILVIYTLYLSALGYGTDFIGLVLFVTTLGISVAIFPAGLCVDRFSGKAILIWSTVLISIAGTGQMLFRNPVLLCVSVFFVGIGIAFQFVLYAPFLTMNSTPAERMHLFSLNMVLVLVTVVLGEVLGGVLPFWLREHPWAMLSDLSWLLASHPLARSYQITLLFAGLLAAPGFIPLFLMTDYRPTYVESEPQRIFLFLRKSLLKCRNNLEKAIATLTRRDTTSFAFWRNVRTFLHGSLVTLVGVNILLGFGAGVLLPYFNLFFVQYLGATSALFGIVDGIANTLNAVGILFAPWIAMRIGRVATILLPRLITLPILLCIGLFPLLPLAAALYPLRQGLTGIPNSVWQVFSMEVVSSEHRGLANSSYQSANKVAWAVAAPVGGFLISRMGYTPVFLVAAMSYLLALVLFWWRFGGKRFSRNSRGS